MSELRAPDPTLTAHERSDVRIVWRRGRATAHTMHPGDHCDQPLGTYMRTEDARWFAVPCRSCFPDAPPPGWQTCGHDVCGPRCKGHGGPDFALSWQTGGDA